MGNPGWDMAMVEPIVRIALSVHSNKGAYAVLLGSGVSASAGIPTGWQIDADLISKVAQLVGAVVGDDRTGCYPDGRVLRRGGDA
jgi:hypothetical protein